MLIEEKYTGTGEDYAALSPEDKAKLTLDDDQCTDKKVTIEIVSGGKNSQDITTTVELSIESDSDSLRPTFGFVDVIFAGAVLRMTDCLFTEFRFRPTYLINSINGGSVYLTNVDFINVEPSQYSHESAIEDEAIDN